MVVPRVMLSVRYIMSELEEMEREDNFRLKRFKECKTKKTKGHDVRKYPCTCDKKPGKGDDFICAMCKEEQERRTRTQKDPSKSVEPCAAEIIGDKASSLHTADRTKLDDLIVHLDKVISLTDHCKTEGLVSPSVDTLLYSCKEVRGKLDEKDQTASAGQSDNEDVSRVTKDDDKKEARVEKKAVCEVCSKCTQTEKEADVCGSFESRFEETVKIKKTKNPDGTVSEEKKVITIRSERRHPEKIDEPEKILSSKDKPESDDGGGSEGDSHGEDKCTCNKAKEAKSEVVQGSKEKEPVKIRVCISDAGENKPAEDTDTCEFCARKNKDDKEEKGDDKSKKDASNQYKVRIVSTCCDPIWREVACSTTGLAENSEEREQLCISMSGEVETNKKNTGVQCCSKDKLEYQSSNICDVCIKSSKKPSKPPSVCEISIKYPTAEQKPSKSVSICEVCSKAQKKSSNVCEVCSKADNKSSNVCEVCKSCTKLKPSKSVSVCEACKARKVESKPSVCDCSKAKVEKKPSLIGEKKEMPTTTINMDIEKKMCCKSTEPEQKPSKSSGKCDICGDDAPSKLCSGIKKKQMSTTSVKYPPESPGSKASVKKSDEKKLCCKIRIIGKKGSEGEEQTQEVVFVGNILDAIKKILCESDDDSVDSGDGKPMKSCSCTSRGNSTRRSGKSSASKSCDTMKDSSTYVSCKSVDRTQSSPLCCDKNDEKSISWSQKRSVSAENSTRNMRTKPTPCGPNAQTEKLKCQTCGNELAKQPKFASRNQSETDNLYCPSCEPSCCSFPKNAGVTANMDAPCEVASDDLSIARDTSTCKMCETGQATRKLDLKIEIQSPSYPHDVKCVSSRNEYKQPVSRVPSSKSRKSLCCGYTPKYGKESGKEMESDSQCCRPECCETACCRTEDDTKKDASTSTRRTERYDVRPLKMIKYNKASCTCHSDTDLLETKPKVQKRSKSCSSCGGFHCT